MEKNNWIDFQPHKKDIRKVLGDLEAVVMEATWQLEKGDVKTIHRRVNQEKKVAVTTIATILDRLYKKGLVKRKLLTNYSLRYEYSPALTKVEFENAVVRDVFKGLLETFEETTIYYLVNELGLDNRGKIDEIRKNIRKTTS
jgi:BlaI family transcriptional regulator, penicillinase repressor